MIPGIDLLQYDNTQSHNFHYIVTNIDEKLTGFSRDQLIKILHAENIIARKYFSPGNHMMEPYKTLSLQKIENFTVTDRLAKSILLLPGGPMVTLMQISEICQLLKKIIANRDQYDLMQSLLN
jgi:dTDP-4-amino-4,6-dideoxygalactose transaminase